MPMLIAGVAHLFVAVIVMAVGGLGFAATREESEPLDAVASVQLVFLATPGPGGGGGGGGSRTSRPAATARRTGTHAISSPVLARRLPPPVPEPRQPPEPPVRPIPATVDPVPPPLEARSLPAIAAPVASSPADEDTREGLLEPRAGGTPADHGPGSEGGAGTGAGTGAGAGAGPGIGPGDGGGSGGGPYRPGSGVEPPRLLREVRADYTDVARRAGVTGDVVLEIVVQRDGAVGDVRILQRLGSGLDERAVDAVRGWRFVPARMRGVPVDVLVEVAVEFRLR